MQQAASRPKKTAKITDAMALTILCEECHEHCVDEYESTMITPDSKTVTCKSCGTVYAIPSNAFYAVSKAKLKEVRK